MLWPVGAWSAAGALAQANALTPPAVATVVERGVALPEAASSWPWMALSVILALLAVISLAARRRLPFGGRV
jgi:hypothetical protein